MLYSRRSRIIWLSFRNFGGTGILFLDAFSSSYIFGHKCVFFIFYKLVDSFDILPVEDIIQREFKKFYLTLNICGVSSFQYHLANLMAHFTFFFFAYLLLYLLLEASGNFLSDFTYDSLVFLLLLIPGILASVSFAQFYALLIKVPIIGLASFAILVGHVADFLLNLKYSFILLIPVTFFSNILTKDVT